MSEVYLEHVTKIFSKPRSVAVDDVSILFERGKTSCLLGPSGCGKTTTLRMIAGLISPTKGDIYFDGQKVTGLPPEKRKVGMVFQFAVVYGSMNVYDNLAIPLRSLNYPRGEIDRLVKETADTFKLTSVLYENPAKLDIGTRQRIALARAMIRRPKVLLLDEPLTNLDPITRVHMRFELKKLQQEWKQTIIYVTHDQSEALTLGDKIAIMNLGRILQYGSQDDIYNKPADTFCASFIGNPAMNLIEANIERINEKLFLIMDSEKYDVSEFKDILQGRSKVIVGIRPEHVEISKNKMNGGIKKKVKLVELLGNNLLLNFEIGGAMIKVKTATLIDVNEGEEVWIRFINDKMRLFDPTTNKLLA